MIPEECGEAGMDPARHSGELYMQEADKSTTNKTGAHQEGEHQDINDNHTKVAAAQGVPPALEGDHLPNGEVTNKDHDNPGPGSEDQSGGQDQSAEEDENAMEVGDVQEPNIEVEPSDDEGKDSSEDDEDKLVISEGNERGTEESADENSKGEPVAAPAKALSRSPTPKRNEKRPAEDDVGVEIATKRPRPLEEMVAPNSLSSVSQVEGSMGQLKRDLEAIEFLIKQKEEEWNTLIRLQKRKEELYLRLVRRRNILLMRNGRDGEEDTTEKKPEDEESEEGNSNLLFLPQGGYSSLGGPQLPLMMMSQLLAGAASPQNLQMLPQIVTTKQDNNNKESNSNISVIDIHTSSNKPGGEVPRVSMTSEAHSKLSKQLTSGVSSMKPILPKPTGAPGGMSSLPSSVSFTATGHGPQGPTVNVQQLIAAHRKENPNTPPIRRATRGAWRHRYDGDKRSSRDQDRPPSVSSSSSDADTRTTPSAKGLLAMSDPSVSYKDVLLRFAELTQIEKQPGSPQISIFPVGNSEGGNKKSEGSRESTPITRDQTPPNLPTTTLLPTSKASLEAPSALARLLLDSRASASSGTCSSVKSSGEPPATSAAAAAAAANSQYLTLSALLSGGSTTTIKVKPVSQSQQENRNKKSSHQTEEGSGNPKCQGCHKQRAQFVCAGCGNQWYCSRECQVAAWEEHSEHCNN